VADEPTAPSAYGTPGGMTIDFHSAEFNRTDDLNDCSGNYRTFQSLDGVVTADMRHHLERLSGEGAAAAIEEAPPPKRPEQEASAPETFVAVSPLTVISRGRTLIIGTDAGRSIACGRRLSEQGLTCTLLVTKRTAAPDASPSKLDQFPLLEVDAVSVTGAFGGFTALVTARGDERPLWERLGAEASVFDLVLDLQSTPSYAGDCLPMGYYAPGANPAALPEVMAELPEMQGRFQRPQFTAFRKSRCFHGRSRTHDCRRCLEVCPFGAIQSADRAISIDHYRCQGCGGCVMVCPADAIQLVHPPREELLSLLRDTLEEHSAGAAFPPTLVISDRETADNQNLPGVDEGDLGPCIHFSVEQIGHAGMEMLLAALAYGAGTIVVACGGQAPPRIQEAVERQARTGSAIVRGLGMPQEMIRFAVIPPDNTRREEMASPPAGHEAQSGRSLLPSAPFSPGHDKRTLVRLAAQYLYDQTGGARPSIPLPAGSPFGAVAVDAACCTLCMACALACPSGALAARGDLPRLEFFESRCHQCGLCGEACPERAISLLPRLLCDPRAVETPAVLHEVEPFRCVECGVPFATQTMIARMKEKLAGHWMYAAERQLRRLQMCGTCRTRDALLSRDMKPWSK
jgi:ferredoxin